MTDLYQAVIPYTVETLVFYEGLDGHEDEEPA
jgi:hypothetical protein